MGTEQFTATTRDADVLSLRQRIADLERQLAAATSGAPQEDGGQRPFDRIFRNVRLIAWEYDRSERRFTFVSPHAEQILGYTLEQWKAPHFWFKTLHPDDRDAAMASSRDHVDRRENHELEYRMVGPDGRFVWFKDITTVLPPDARQPSLQGVLIDITDRKLVEAELSASEQRLQTVAENLPGAVYSYDREEGGPRRLVYLGPGLETVVGPQHAAKIEHDFDFLFALIHPDDQPRLTESVRSGVESGSIIAIECRLLHDSGRYVWVRSASRPIRLTATRVRWHVLLIDIDEEKRARVVLEALAEQTSGVVGEQFFASVVESIARALDTPAVLVCEPLADTPDRWHSRAFWNADRLADNIEFDVIDQPWCRIAGGESVDINRDDVSDGAGAEPFRRTGAKHLRGFPLFDSTGQVIGGLLLLSDRARDHAMWEVPAIRLAASRMSAEIQRVRTEAVLHRSRTNIRMMVDQMPAIMWTTDTNLVLSSSSGRGLHDLGFKPDQSNGTSLYDFLPDDEAGRRTISMHKRAASGRSVNFENTFANRHYQCHIETLRDSAGAIKGTIGVALDITERKKTQRRLELMMRELDHRVRNNLSSLTSIAHEIASSTDSVPQFVDALTGRIAAMARAYDVIAQSRATDVQWRTVLTRLLAPYADPDDPRIELVGTSIALPPSVAFPLCMVVNELATNAAKHGALRTGNGRLEVRWSLDELNMLDVDWREMCERPISPPAASGFGHSVIDGLIQHQLHGSVELRYEPAGLAARMAIPLPCEPEVP